VCERAVATALKRLRELGILNWVRRCAQSWQDGRFVLEQETNLRRAASDAVAGAASRTAGASAGHLGRSHAHAVRVRQRHHLLTAPAWQALLAAHSLR
jgi:hypothetical protein